MTSNALIPLEKLRTRYLQKQYVKHSGDGMDGTKQAKIALLSLWFLKKTIKKGTTKEIWSKTIFYRQQLV